MQDILLELADGDATTVATNKERLEGIESRLNTIDEHLGIAPRVKHMTLWTRAGDHKVVAGLVVAAILGAASLIAGAFYSQANAYLDGRIHVQLAPVTSQLTTIDERTSHIEGELSILRAELVAQKYSSIPRKDLKGHREELKNLKNNLAAAPKDTPNLWPASFQIITLLSQAMYQLETVGRLPLSTYSNVRITNFGRAGLVRSLNVSLENTIEGFTFEDSVIHFDASTKLINVQFTRCVFIFPQEANPPQPLQQIGASLLASDLESVRITGG